MSLSFLLADRGDSERATVALLANFRCDCFGCELMLNKQCGATLAG